jgi:diguanylate cyclase (GGDEF)-like protein
MTQSMGLFRAKTFDTSRDENVVKTKSGVVPALPSLADNGIWKAWDDDIDDSEVTGATSRMPASRRAKGKPHLTIMTGFDAGKVVALSGRAIVIGRSHTADLRSRENEVSRQHCRIVDDNGVLYVEDLGSTNGTLVNGAKVERAQLSPGDRIQLGTDLVLQLDMFDAAEETLARKLFDGSTRDPLTRAFNCNYFGDRLNAEISHAKRHATSLSVMMLDLDGLKSVNDAHGRDAGDEVLRAVVVAITQAIRSEDVFCRYGGDEFAFLVRDPLGSAARAAERLRTRIEALRVTVGKKTVRVTASIGVVEVGEPGAQLTREGLVRVAEKRLNRAKLLGRNRVCID